MSKKSKPKTNSAAGAFIGMIIGLTISLALQLYLIPYLPFVTSNYLQYLPVGITTAILTSFLEFLGSTTTLDSMKLVFKLARHAISIFGLYYLIRIFPFDFGQISMAYLNQTILFAFYVAVFGITIAILIDLVKLLLSLLNPKS